MTLTSKTVTITPPHTHTHTPAYNDVSPYHVWLQKVEHFRRYCPDKQLNLSYHSPWPWSLQINIFTGHFCLWWSNIQLNLVAKESLVQKLQWICSYLDTNSQCDLDLKDCNLFSFLHIALSLNAAPPLQNNRQECLFFFRNGEGGIQRKYSAPSPPS